MGDTVLDPLVPLEPKRVIKKYKVQDWHRKYCGASCKVPLLLSDGYGTLCGYEAESGWIQFWFVAFDPDRRMGADEKQPVEKVEVNVLNRKSYS